MKGVKQTILLAFALALALPASAGGCSYEIQACLDHLARMRDRGFAGVDLDGSSESGAMIVTKVYGETPAEAAGIRIGDELLSIAGIPLDGSEDSMKKLEAAMKPGRTVDFAVSRDGERRTIPIALARMPDDVFARFVGDHMLKHVTVAESSGD
jgi:predicted metalloprotease with PDZ domain